MYRSQQFLSPEGTHSNLTQVGPLQSGSESSRGPRTSSSLVVEGREEVDDLNRSPD